MASSPPRRPHLVWPVILIGLGIILLLNNLGWFPWDIWVFLGRFWPVILILFGLELLLSRTKPWLATVVAVVLVLLIIGGGLTAAAFGLGDSGLGALPVMGDVGASQEQGAQPLEQAERAMVDVQFGAGDLAISGLPGDSGNLMEGDFGNAGDGRGVSRSFKCHDNDCTLRLTASSRDGWPFGGGGSGSSDEWLVKLSPRIPLDLRIRSGASRLNLDLSALQLSALRLDVGASSGTVTLPQAIAGQAVIKAGAADLDLVMPQGTAARIQTRGGLSTFRVDEQRFPRDGSYYVSPDYAKATNRIDLSIDAGVATITVR